MSTSTTKWLPASKSAPCPVCDHDGWCAVDELGEVAKCMRLSDGAFKSQEDGSGLAHFHRLREPAAIPLRIKRDRPVQDWRQVQQRCREALTESRRNWLVNDLMVSPEALDAIGVGWHHEYRVYTFPERFPDGTIIGIATRKPDGRKAFLKGGNRGLIIPPALNLAEPVVVVEGPSDVAACLTIGVGVVGRPSNTGGAAMLAELLRDGGEVFILAENDEPGITGAKAIAARLAEIWGRPVPWVLPPHGAKDIRAWLVEHDAHTTEELREVLL